LGSPAVNDSRVPNSLPFDTGGILFSSSQAATSPQIYLPTQWQALQLWQIFINNFDPIVKILHIPTAQVNIYGAINDANSAQI
jgi:hypothetical protein